MSKPLMFASFTWYKTFCFDVPFKREETQGVQYMSPREHRDLATHNYRHKD